MFCHKASQNIVVEKKIKKSVPVEHVVDSGSTP
jgi:hypothetical protein